MYGFRLYILLNTNELVFINFAVNKISYKFIALNQNVLTKTTQIMKKNTLLIALFSFLFFITNQLNAQILQYDANWPNTAWSIEGNYTTVGLVKDPRVDANYSYDDDLSGSGSLGDEIYAISPEIDLTAAFIGNEKEIQLTFNYVYRRVGDTFSIEWFDGTDWIVWEQIYNNSNNFDYKTCSSMQQFIGQPLLISNFTALQLLTFKYRIRYINGGFDYGFCMDSPILTSIPTSACIPVDTITIDSASITFDSAQIDWNDSNVPLPENGWEIEYGPTGFAQGTGVIVTATTHPYTIFGLSGNTEYDVYIRTLCNDTEQSDWSGPTSFTTPAAPVACGGQYVDTGGAANPYSINENESITICPDNTGDIVTLQFSFFDTEQGWDGLMIYNGPDTNSPIISSGSTFNRPTCPNGAWTGTGQYAPGIISSTDASGCLTLVFTSDGLITRDGWVANIICGPPPTCDLPTNLNVTNITQDGAEFSWTDTNTPPPANGWEIVIVPAGVNPASGTPIPVTSSPYITNTLNASTAYDFYVRAVCDDQGNPDPSFYAGPISFQTLIAPPACGGVYVDSGGPTSNYENDEDITYTICPDNTGEIVTLEFVSFDVENGWDFLTIYNGDSTASPVIGTYTGTALPPFAMAINSTGCLTVVFTSDGLINRAGWVANVVCIPEPTCWPITNLTVGNPSTTSLEVNWTDDLNGTPAGGWNIEYGPTGFTQGTGTIVNTTTNPFVLTDLLSSTNYDVYVQAVCVADGSDLGGWVGPVTGRTDDAPPPNDTCATAIPIDVTLSCEPTIGNNILATNSTILEGEVMPNCPDPAANGDNGYELLDVWFSFVVPASGTVMVETSNMGGMVDTVLAAYTGTCGNLTELACQDDSVINVNSDDFRFSSLELKNLTVGETIYLRVWSYPAYVNEGDTVDNIQGAFGICVYGQSRGYTGTLNTNDNSIENLEVNYYPNPATDNVTITSNETINKIQLYDVLGQLVKTETYQNAQNEVNFKLLNISSGTYFVKVYSKTKSNKFTIIKK